MSNEENIRSNPEVVAVAQNTSLPNDVRRLTDFHGLAASEDADKGDCGQLQQTLRQDTFRPIFYNRWTLCNKDSLKTR